MSLKRKTPFVPLFKAMLFVGACLAVSFVVVFPLWAFAKNAPRAYSAAVITAAAFVAGWKFVAWAKQSGAKKTVRTVLKCAVAVAGIFLAFRFLLLSMRIHALVAAVSAIALFKLADAAFKKT